MTTGNATTAGGGGLSGIYPYPVSPLDGRGRVDERALRRLVGHLLDEGVHGLSPSDSTGEVTHLTPAQREAVCGSPSTRPPAGCRSSRGWRPSPAPMPRPRRRPWPRGGSTASSASSWSTASRPPTRSSTTSTRSPRPRTCRSSSARIRVSDLPLSALERIVADETVQYLEDASGVTGRLLTIRPALGGRLRFFAASAHLPAAALDLGGVGRMAGPACVAPAAAVALWDAHRRGDLVRRARLQEAIWPLNALFVRHGAAPLVKLALDEAGYPCGDPVRPQRPAPESVRGELRAVLAGIAEALDA
nr:dihydrodipicolinate synthase family protein [Propionibacterium acidifaciens]